MLRRFICLGLLFASCVESNTTLDGGVSGKHDVGVADSAVVDSGIGTDAGATIATLSIVHADGQPADGSLVYGLDGQRGHLLGRADHKGQYELRTVPERLLVRHAFDEVQIFEASDEDQSVVLESVTDHPETLELRGVGLEFRVLKSDANQISFLLAGDRIFAVRQLSSSRSQVVEVNVDDGTEREVFRSDAPGDRAFSTHLRWLPPKHLLVADSEFTDLLDAQTVRFSVLDLDAGTSLGPTVWTSGSFGLRTVDSFITNETAHIVVLSPRGGEFELTHHQFLLNEGRVVEGSLQNFGSPRACQLYPGQLYFQQEERLWKFDVGTSTITRVFAPRTGQFNCYGSWIGPRGVTTHHIENGEFVLASEQGEHLRQPVPWPPGGEAWFVGAGDLRGRPFVTTGVVTTNDFRGFLVVPDPVEASVALLDVESVFGHSVQLWGPAYPVGDRYVALIAEDGPTQPPYQKLSMNRDGSDLRLEAIILRAGCRPLEAGPFTAWPSEVSLMNCLVRERRFALFSDGQDSLQRTFHSLEQWGEVVKWGKLRLYQSGEGDEAGIYAFDLEAPR